MSERARIGLLIAATLLLLWVAAPNQYVRIEKVIESQVEPVLKHATKEEKRENKALIISYAKALGYGKGERKCLLTLWTRESRLDHKADNPRSTAFGIAQLLRERSREPELQILHGLRYFEHRYGKSACRALDHSNRRGWY
jgi:hypothetical protein